MILKNVILKIYIYIKWLNIRVQEILEEEELLEILEMLEDQIAVEIQEMLEDQIAVEIQEGHIVAEIQEGLRQEGHIAVEN